MKFIHLSDLHIGKRVNEISMIEDQEYILNEILQIIDDEKPKAILISGDVYDNGMPPSEAVALFDKFICSLSERKLDVFIISGNHDNATRLSFGGRLMETSGIHISPVYNGIVSPVTLHDEYGNLNFWMLPFIKPTHVKRFFPEENIENYTDACRVAIENMHINKNERNIILAHQFVTGASTCESEEINVGGIDNVSAEVFSDFNYVALGHIHGPQNIKSSKIRYCGTPLKYSFSEEKHHKSVTVVEIDAKGEITISTPPLVPLHDLRTVKGRFEDVIKYPYTEDYIQIILTDEDDIPEAVGRLRVVFPNKMDLHYDNTRTSSNQIINPAEDIKNRSPIDLLEELYYKQNNQNMSDTQKKFAIDIIESIKEKKI